MASSLLGMSELTIWPVHLEAFLATPTIVIVETTVGWSCVRNATDCPKEGREGEGVGNSNNCMDHNLIVIITKIADMKRRSWTKNEEYIIMNEIYYMNIMCTKPDKFHSSTYIDHDFILMSNLSMFSQWYPKLSPPCCQCQIIKIANKFELPIIKKGHC